MEPFYWYFRSVFYDFCEIESYGMKLFCLLSLKQIYGKTKSIQGDGLGPKNQFPEENKVVKRVPLLMGLFLFNLTVLSLLKHKETRFLASIFVFGQLSVAYMITIMFDIREVLVMLISAKYGKKSETTKKYRNWLGYLLRP